MLREILTVSGKPGLFRLIARGTRALVVEQLDEQKRRSSVLANDKVVSLGDISIFTDTEEMPLGEVFKTFYEKSGGKPLEVNLKAANDELMKFFGTFIPAYDHDRVYANHVRKMVTWYNLLLAAGITEFVEKPEEEQIPVQVEEAPKEEAAEPAKKPAAKKPAAKKAAAKKAEQAEEAAEPKKAAAKKTAK